MKRAIILLMASGIASGLFCMKKDQARIISVISAVGDVTIVSQGKEIQTNAGSILKQNDTIITGKASFVDISFLDKGVLRVGENSKINIDVLAANENVENAKLNMEKGILTVTISRLRKNSSFEVKTSTSVAAVRGTTLHVVSDEASSKVFVVKGKVSVTPVSDGSKVSAAEKVVEENYAVSLKKDDVKEIVEKKKELLPVVIAKAEMVEIKEVLKSVVSHSAAKENFVQEASDIVAEEIVEEKKEAVKAPAPRVQKQNKSVSTPEVKTEQPAIQTEKKKTSNIPLAPNL